MGDVHEEDPDRGPCIRRPDNEHIIPMATKYQSSLIDNVYKMRELFPADKAAHLSSKNMEIIEDIANRTIFIKEKVDEMVNARKIANKIESEAGEGDRLPRPDRPDDGSHPLPYRQVGTGCR